MDADTKAACVGVAASGAVPSVRVQKDIDKCGHPYSHTEVKPIAMLQRLCEHHRVTHIVDFAAGSGALAIAVAGTHEYEGIAANQAHREWLDSTLDRCIMFLAGKKEKGLAKRLGCDDEFLANVGKYFGSGTMMDARRLVEPESSDEEGEGESDDDDEEEGGMTEESGGGEG